MGDNIYTRDYVVEALEHYLEEHTITELLELVVEVLRFKMGV